MELRYFISLIFIFALNVLFFFSGICLNSVVILSFWKSAQLRKKLCYFMIMVLSCFDLLVVLSSHPCTAHITMLWLTGKLDVYPSGVDIPTWITNIFIAFSLLVLLVMNFDRYLATYYPIFHRTSVTKGRLLTLLAILIIVFLTFALMAANDFFISYEVGVITFFIIVSPPMVFINYKLFTNARKSRRISPEMKKSFSLKNISSCLLAVACFVLLLSIPVFVFLGLKIGLKENEFTLNNANVAGLWSHTIVSMNGTLNCLIFYWKNKILSTEGMKIIKSLKVCRRTKSPILI